MKRILSILLILSFLCSLPLPSFAENDYEFIFRNGVKWGMSESEIRDLEAEEIGGHISAFVSSTPDGHNLSTLDRYYVPVGKYQESELYYFLYDDSLYCTAYSIDEQIDIEDMVRALSGEYGGEAPVSYIQKAKFLSYFFSPAGEENYRETVLELMSNPVFDAAAETMHYWTLPDGTEVLIGVNSLEKYTSSFLLYWNRAYRTMPVFTDSLADLQPAPTPQPTSTPSPTPAPTPTPTPVPPPDKVTLLYSDGREVSCSLSEMRSALGGKPVLLRNDCMDLETDCDMTLLYEAMDFAVLKGAVEVKAPLTREQYETAQSWTETSMSDLAPGSNKDFYSWQRNYFIMLFPTLNDFSIWDNRDGTCLIRFGFRKHDGRTDEETAEYITKGREAAIQIVNSIPASCFTGNRTDYKQLEYLYDYITCHVNYYDDSVEPGKYHSDGNYYHLLYDALVLKETVCAGFAYSFAYLCELAGIDAQYVVVMPFRPDGNTHAVVIAKEGGSYKWFDPTWDEDKNLTGFDFFGIDDTGLFVDHTQYHNTYYPRSLYPDCNYDMTRGRMGYWDFDTMTYRSFTSEHLSAGRYMISSALDKNRVLEIGGSSKANGGNAQLWWNGYQDSQLFDISKVGDDFIIRNCGSSLVLDVAGGNASPGTNVQQYESNSTSAQKWKIEPVGYNSEGYYYIKSVLKDKRGAVPENLYLEIEEDSAFDGANVRVATYSIKDNQKWRFTEVNNTSVIDGRYYISTALDNNKVLETDDYSEEGHGNAQIYYNQPSGISSYYFQRFDVYQDSGGYVLKNQGSGLVLAVDANRNVCQMKYGRALSSQRWTMKSAGNGYFYIKSASGDYYLEVAGSRTDSGTKVQVSAFTGKDNQKWRLNLTARMVETS